MAGMTEGYKAAMAQSYANQGNRAEIPEKDLGQEFLFELGFQPMGISSRRNKDGSTCLAIAAYFEPATCLFKTYRTVDGNFLGSRIIEVEWVRSVDYLGKSVRLFPDILESSGANRCQIALLAPDEKIWVNRNGDGDFYIIGPPNQRQGGRRELIGQISVPGAEMLHSACFRWTSTSGTQLCVIQSKLDLTEWKYQEYDFHYEGPEGKLVLAANEANNWPLQPYTYGIGFRKPDEPPFLITDARCAGKKEIISQIVPEEGDISAAMMSGIWGNGIAFLEDGSALVTAYGQAEPGPFNGSPGRLIYLPAKAFPR